ncbi:MAG: DUF4190 domain-containing protein [Candidatus Omnitrophica bacterium]|nr:DUF4190 domain-containing protein [Candidatus Omnitrophota bacterium]
MQGLAIASLVMGIIGVVICWIGIGIIPSVLALIFGIIACIKKEARGLAAGGIILGFIGTVISIAIIFGAIYIGSRSEKFWKTTGKGILNNITEGKKMLESITEQAKGFEEYSEQMKKEMEKYSKDMEKYNIRR